MDDAGDHRTQRETRHDQDDDENLPGEGAAREVVSERLPASAHFLQWHRAGSAA